MGYCMKFLWAGTIMLAAACQPITQPFPPFERQNHLVVRDQQQFHHLTLDEVAGKKANLSKAVATIASQYRHDGEGMIHITIAASPGAAEQAQKIITSALHGTGIQKTSILVTKVDAQPRGVVLGYRALKVDEPDCAELPIGDAPMGCAMDRHLARMVVRPGDLLGRDDLGPMTSQRASDAVRRYNNFQAPVAIQSPILPTTNAGVEGGS